MTRNDLLELIEDLWGRIRDRGENMTRNGLLKLIEDLWEYATGDPIEDMDEDDAECQGETAADLYRRVRQTLDEKEESQT